MDNEVDGVTRVRHKPTIPSGYTAPVMKMRNDGLVKVDCFLAKVEVSIYGEQTNIR